MSFRDRQWMPLFIEDFRMDTLDLEADEIGTYITMIWLAWARGDGSVSGDMKELKKTLQRCLYEFHGLTFNRIVPKLLARYFERRQDGRYYQKRVEKELRIARELSENQSRNAKERWSKVNEPNSLGNAAAMPTLHNTTHKKGWPGNGGTARAVQNVKIGDTIGGYVWNGSRWAEQPDDTL